MDGQEIVVEENLDTACNQAAVNVPLVDHETTPGRHHGRGGDEKYAVSIAGELLCQGATHDIGVVIEDHHRRVDRESGQECRRG